MNYTEEYISAKEEEAWANLEAKTTKTIRVYALEVWYGYGNGWECEGWHATRRSALNDLKAYRANCDYAVRIRPRRLKREEVFPLIQVA